MRKLLFILIPAIALSAIAMAWPGESTEPIPSITSNSITRNVYDGITKVGELSFVIKKYTPLSGEGWVKVAPGDVEFIVTNTDYMTVTQPMPMQEEIDIQSGAVTEQDDWSETCPIQIVGETWCSTDPAFSFWTFFFDGFDWEDFYDDCDNQADTDSFVEYRNLGADTEYMPDSWLWLEVKEETS
jgi:hypothetical protein